MYIIYYHWVGHCHCKLKNVNNFSFPVGLIPIAIAIADVWLTSDQFDH